VRFARGARRAAVFLAAVLGLRVTLLALVALIALRAPLALPAVLALRALRAALLALPALIALLALLALAAFRARATAEVFFRAALFLAVRRARDFARVDPFFLVAAAFRLAIAVVLSATGLP